MFSLLNTTCAPEPEPPPSYDSFQPSENLRPIYVKMVHSEDINKNLLSYDAEYYEGTNDSEFINHLTDLTEPELDDDLTLADISAYVNTMHTKTTQDTFSLHHIETSLHSTRILQMKINLQDQQMDSGANRNVTNDRSIIRNYSTITPIPIFGIDNREAACHIIGKGITEIETTDGSSLEIQMFYSVHCSGTIISPNAIVLQSKNFTSWTQTSHLDTGSAQILFYHRLSSL